MKGLTDDEIKFFSDRIKFRRIQINKSQEECARVLNISRPTFDKLEKDPSKLDINQLIILSDFLGYNFVEFFLDTILQIAKKEEN